MHKWKKVFIYLPIFNLFGFEIFNLYFLYSYVNKYKILRTIV